MARYPDDVCRFPDYVWGRTAVWLLLGNVPL